MKFEDYQFPCKYEKPYSHQVETVKFCLSNKRAFNLSTMGTGKTLSSLWAADFLMINKKIKTVLIIAPLSTLLPVWNQEIFESLHHRKSIVVHHPNKAKRIEKLDKEADFYIINHDGIKVIEDQIVKKKFDLIIIDELTAYKNFSSDRTKCMWRIARKAKGVWGLTGSPTANDPTEAFGQAKVVNERNKYLPRYFGQFRDMVMIKDEFQDFSYTPRPGWEKTVSAVLSPSIRYTLRDCVDLPPTVFEEREIEMGPKQVKAYKQMEKDFIAESEKGMIVASNAGVKYLKLLQISSGVVYAEDQDPVRLDPKKKLAEIINIYGQVGNEPVIVFIAFKEAMAMVEEFLSSKGYKVAVMNGDTSAMKRGQIVADFQAGKIDFLLLQPRVASHGLTLTRSNVIIWYTPYPSNEVYQQANARIVRPGQGRPQLIIRLYSSPSEKRLYSGLDSKERLSTLLMELLRK